MTRTIHISDEAYATIAETAASTGRTPESVIEEWAAQLARDPDQAWFWTPEWQAGECEADADLAAGRVTHFERDEEFLAALRERAKHADS